MTKEKDPRGRPTIYSAEIADEICRRLSEGESLNRICAEERFPAHSTVRHWALEDREGFFARYARARDIGADCMADELLDIADDGTNDWMEKQTRSGATITTINQEHVQRSRLRVDTRKWYLSKIAPKRYSDRMIIDNVGQDDGMKELAAAIRNSPLTEEGKAGAVETTAEVVEEKKNDVYD